jgi:DNA-binding LytR/AlgR family response regulator
MMKIAICDDEVKELNKTKAMCEKYISLHSELNVRINSFTSPEELLHITQQEQFDILLLDIYMPAMTGTELARTLREKNIECQIVFLTTSLSHAVEAFSLHAAHYLVKPYTADQFEDALSKAVSAVERRKKFQIKLKTTDGVQKINLSDILYSETEGHVQRIHLTDRCLQVRITCCDLFEMLSNDHCFFKCGSSYILNLGKIEEVSARSILFENGEQIPMQRRQYKELLDRYTGYSLEGN